MASPPYNPETGAWTVFGDPRPLPSAQGANQTAVVSMAPTRPEALTTQAVLTGDIKEASKFIPLARQQMTLMHQINVNDLEIYNRPVDLGGGRRMNCQRNFTADRAHIHVPGGGKGSLGALHLNFDPSVMTDFGLQTIFDKNHGLPLYMNEFSGSLSQSGLHLVSEAGETSYKSASGTLYNTDKSNDVNGRTCFVAVNASLPFVESEGITMVGPGSFHFFNQVMTPHNSTLCSLNGYSSGASNDDDGVFSVLRVSAPGFGNNYEIKHNNDHVYSHIVSYRTRGLDVSTNEHGAISSNQFAEFFVDGQKILESTSETTTWGSYYPDNRSMYYFNTDSYLGSSLSIKQKMLYAAHLDDSQIREVTDNLAAKWGF